MLKKIRPIASRGLQSIAAILVFVIMLPVTVAMMLLMMVASISIIATLRSRSWKSNTDIGWESAVSSSVRQAKNNPQKPPIEGSCTVVEK